MGKKLNFQLISLIKEIGSLFGKYLATSFKGIEKKNEEGKKRLCLLIYLLHKSYIILDEKNNYIFWRTFIFCEKISVFFSFLNICLLHLTSFTLTFSTLPFLRCTFTLMFLPPQLLHSFGHPVSIWMSFTLDLSSLTTSSTFSFSPSPFQSLLSSSWPLIFLFPHSDLDSHSPQFYSICPTLTLYHAAHLYSFTLFLSYSLHPFHSVTPPLSSILYNAKNVSFYERAYTTYIWARISLQFNFTLRWPSWFSTLSSSLNVIFVFS